MYALIESFESIQHHAYYSDPNIPNNADGKNLANQAFGKDLVGRFLRTGTVIDGVWQPTLPSPCSCQFLIMSPFLEIHDVPQSNI
jgi:hypothetical protein